MRKRVLLPAMGAGLLALLQLGKPSALLRADAADAPVPVEPARVLDAVEPAPSLLGASGEAAMCFVRAGESVAFPLRVPADAPEFTYRWVRAGSGEPGDVARPLGDGELLAPLDAGVYELELRSGEEVRRLDRPRLAVLVPFERKLGGDLNGYRIGHYPAEWARSRDDLDRPPGFLEVFPEDTTLPLSTHLRVADFLVHDRQTRWPRYVAVDPRVVDKIELVLGELARRRGDLALRFDVRVHSGFRTPLHNAGVEGAARDSRHLYGDAADVAIDADGDGRFTLFDAYRVEQAVEWIERTHPELSGGLGVYTSRRWPTPYVHVDARGERKRWRG